MTFSEMFAAKDAAFATTVRQTGITIFKAWLLFKGEADATEELNLDRDIDRFALTKEEAILTAIKNHEPGYDETFNRIFADHAPGNIVVMSMELPGKYMDEEVIIPPVGEDTIGVHTTNPEYDVSSDTFYATTRGRLENPHTVNYDMTLIDATGRDDGSIQLMLPSDAVVATA